MSLNILGVPFVLPKFRRFLGAPYKAMQRECVDVLFDRVLGPWAQQTRGGGAAALGGLRFVDLGSGDGRLVRTAAQRGMPAVGYELNPYLVLLSRMRMTSATEQMAPAVRWANLWDADLRTADVVTVYGRSGDNMMQRLVEKCEAELPQKAVVVSYLQDMPGWDRILVMDVNGLKLYDLSRLPRGQLADAE